MHEAVASTRAREMGDIHTLSPHHWAAHVYLCITGPISYQYQQVGLQLLLSTLMDIPSVKTGQQLYINIGCVM